MAKKIKSINEINGQKIKDDNVFVSLFINPICENHIGFIRCKVFKDEFKKSLNIVFEFKKDSEVMNKLDGTIEKIEREIICHAPTNVYRNLFFFIIYK